MKIIVTGAAGFLGSGLVRRLLDEGAEVLAVDNYSFGFRENISELLSHLRFRMLEKDFCDPEVLKNENADVIVHLASMKIPRYGKAFDTLDRNLSMIRNAVHFAIKSKARIVFASTSDVYGKNPVLPFNEESDLLYGPSGVHRWVYAQSKLVGEQLLSSANTDYGLPYTVARIFSSFGPRQHPEWWGGPQSVFISKAFCKEPLPLHGDGLQTRTFTYMEDTVEALFRMVTAPKPLNGIVNVGSGKENEISMKALAEKIWKMIQGDHSETKLEYVPYESFGRYEDVRSRIPDTTKLKIHFDFTCCIPLEEGLQRTIEWHRKRYGM